MFLPPEAGRPAPRYGFPADNLKDRLGAALRYCFPNIQPITILPPHLRLLLCSPPPAAAFRSHSQSPRGFLRVWRLLVSSSILFLHLRFFRELHLGVTRCAVLEDVEASPFAPPLSSHPLAFSVYSPPLQEILQGIFDVSLSWGLSRSLLHPLTSAHLSGSEFLLRLTLCVPLFRRSPPLPFLTHPPS